MRSRLRGALATLAVIVLVAAGAAAFFGPDFAAWAIVGAPNRGLPRPAPLAALGAGERELRVDVGPPAASLSVVVREPSARPRGTVLVLHGVRDRGASMAGVARGLADEGWRAARVDLRGHGRSTGDFLTYGVVESRDLRQVVDAIDRAGLLAPPLAVLGVSYGAALAVQLAAADPRVAAVAAVAPFSSLQAVLPSFARVLLPGGEYLPAGFFARTLRRASAISGADLSLASPVDAAGRSRAAMLIVAGTADRNIPPANARAIVTAAAGRAELRLVTGATHETVLAAALPSVVAWLGDRAPAAE
jgi:alpha-beta hydrolase superfamily lysophospholipase